MNFSGKSQGDIASLLNVPRGMINQIGQKLGYLQDMQGNTFTLPSQPLDLENCFMEVKNSNYFNKANT